MIDEQDNGFGGGGLYGQAARKRLQANSAQAEKTRTEGDDSALGTAGGALGAIIGAYFGGPSGAVAGWGYGQKGGQMVAAMGDGRSQDASDRFVQTMTSGVDLLGKKKKPEDGQELWDSGESLGPGEKGYVAPSGGAFGSLGD